MTILDLFFDETKERIGIEIVRIGENRKRKIEKGIENKSNIRYNKEKVQKRGKK